MLRCLPGAAWKPLRAPPLRHLCLLSDRICTMRAAALCPRLPAAHKARPQRASAQLCTPRRPLAARGGFLLARAAPEGKEPRADRRHRMVADTSDEEEAYLPSDEEADIPVKQRLHSVDLFREMTKLPPEYPPEPAPYDPDAHRTVADMASDDKEELPDDPTAMDEELITDTKPFITDVYNQTAGVRRKARNAEASTTSSAGPEDSPKVHPAGPASRPPAGPRSNMPPGATSRMSVGDKPDPAEGEREARMVQAEEEATDMRHGPGQTQRLGEHEEEAFGGGKGSPKAAVGGPGHGAGRSATDVPSASEGGSGQGIREEKGSGGWSPEDRARRRALEQLGGIDRIPPGGSAFLDKEAVLRRQEGRP